MKDNYLTAIIRFFAFMVSLVFGFYGVAILFSSPSAYLIAFSVLMISYCIAISTLLIMTNMRLIRNNKINLLKRSNTTLAILLPLAWFIGCLDVGIISGQEILSLILVAICSAIAWFGVTISIKNNKKFA